MKSYRFGVIVQSNLDKMLCRASALQWCPFINLHLVRGQREFCATKGVWSVPGSASVLVPFYLVIVS